MEASTSRDLEQVLQRERERYTMLYELWKEHRGNSEAHQAHVVKWMNDKGLAPEPRRSPDNTC